MREIEKLVTAIQQQSKVNKELALVLAKKIDSNQEYRNATLDKRVSIALNELLNSQ